MNHLFQSAQYTHTLIVLNKETLYTARVHLYTFRQEPSSIATIFFFMLSYSHRETLSSKGNCAHHGLFHTVLYLVKFLTFYMEGGERATTKQFNT